MATNASPCPRRYKISAHIEVFRFGNPIPTSCPLSHPDDDVFTDVQSIPYFNTHEEKGNLLLTRTLECTDGIFGFGQHVGGINKRGRRLDLFCGQAIPHNPTNWRSNGNYPFFIHRTDKGMTGFFFDYPSHIAADLGYESSENMQFRVSTPHIDIYVYHGDDALALCRSHTEVCGTSFLPPLWAFGYHQCRYSYETEEEVKAVRDGFREHGIPIDAIYMDIDYMDHYKVFSVHRDRFPDLPGLINEMKQDGIELVPIIDPGVKIEKDYYIYESGIAGDHFCKDEHGHPFVGAVWPGLTHLPDFMKPETRTWWGNFYTRFTDLGIRGFWNDMNEPEIFYCPEELDAVKERLASVDYHSFEDRDAIDFLQSLSSWWQKESYYDRFYQEFEGELIPHRMLHNLYGMMMTRSVREALEAHHPDERFLLLSRASTSGSHRYGGVWTGDNHSWWEHLRLNIQMVTCLSMAGQLYSGADIGGHCDEPSPELLIRWTQLGMFFPLFRNHTVKESKPQEPYAFAEKDRKVLAEAIRFRYALLPSLYGGFMIARREGIPLIRPLIFMFNDDNCISIDDQFMLGDHVMVAPVITPACSQRHVYLPEASWLQLIGPAWNQLEASVLPQGSHMVHSPIDRTPMYLRENGILIMTEPCESTASYNPDHLHGIGFIKDIACYRYYEDDGMSRSCDSGSHALVDIQIEKLGEDYAVSFDIHCGHDYQLRAKTLSLKLYDAKARLVKKTIVIE